MDLEKIVAQGKKDLTGQKVICRSNEGEPYGVGICKGYTDLDGRAFYPIPLVEFDGNEKVCMGIVLPYSEELAAFLDTMSPRNQWLTLLPLIMKED